jgi:hypothetical protein
MQRKLLFTVLLAAIVLSLSTWAAVCDLSCAIDKLSFHASHCSPSHPMSSHCKEMGYEDGMAMSSASHQLQSTEECGPQHCHSSDLLNATPSTDLRLSLVAFAGVLVAELPVPTSLVSHQIALGIPPPRSAALDPIHWNLRI